jgi:valyl-tRNA synthetase
LWWGHRLPVWYRGAETFVGTQAPPGEGWTRDPDVLDTWFSSALWPFATLGWPDQTPQLRAFYPTDVLVTARDIVFLWVARMIMMGLEFTGEVPFSDVYVHSIIQAPDGRRMSKSLGTGIDPLDLIEGGPRPPVFAKGSEPAGDFPAYGADAVRWGLLAMSSGQDVRFSEDKVAQGLQLTNKLWNAARLILLGIDPQARAGIASNQVEDRWILSRLQRAKDEIALRIDRYDFSHAALALYDFVYGELCDWYLELVKPRLRAGEAELSSTLLHVLTETVALAHPLIPFETEEIYAHIPGAQGLLAARVVTGEEPLDEPAEQAIAHVIEAVQALRTWRDRAGVKAGAIVSARLVAHGYDEVAEHLARLARVAFIPGDSVQSTASIALADLAGPNPPAVVATVPIPGGTVEILAGSYIDVEGAQRKLQQRRAKLEAEIERGQRKLANQGFVAKAPADVVRAERDKLERLRAELEST